MLLLAPTNERRCYVLNSSTTRNDLLAEDENHGISETEISKLKEMLAENHGRFGDRNCHLTVIGDKNRVDRFTDALRSCFLTDDEIELWFEGHEFDDPWPQNMVKLSN